MKLNFSFKDVTILYVFNVIFSYALLYFYGKSIGNIDFYEFLKFFGFCVFWCLHSRLHNNFSNGWLSKTFILITALSAEPFLTVNMSQITIDLLDAVKVQF